MKTILHKALGLLMIATQLQAVAPLPHSGEIMPEPKSIIKSVAQPTPTPSAVSPRALSLIAAGPSILSVLGTLFLITEPLFRANNRLEDSVFLLATTSGITSIISALYYAIKERKVRRQAEQTKKVSADHRKDWQFNNIQQSGSQSMPSVVSPLALSLIAAGSSIITGVCSLITGILLIDLFTKNKKIEKPILFSVLGVGSITGIASIGSAIYYAVKEYKARRQIEKAKKAAAQASPSSF